MAEFDRYTNDYDAMLEASLAPLGGFNDYYLLQKVTHVEMSVQKTEVRAVLDFGCGLGGTTHMLKNRFNSARVVGIDISENSIKQAKLKYPDVEFGNLGDDSFMDKYAGQFDIIYVANVFHHIPLLERESAILMLKSLLTAKGKIFFFEHNPYNPVTKWVVSRCAFDMDAILLKPRDARSLFINAEFQIDKTVYLLFFPHMLRRLSKFEPFLKWLPLGAQYCVTASL